ncbi:unnamed protein product [Ixodes hexagonus]
MPDLGCFRNGGHWFHLLYRPLSVLPDDRHLVNTSFMLFTRDNPDVQEYFRFSSHRDLEESYFRPYRPTKLIVHGFMDNIVIGPWIFEMKDRFLDTMDCNVIVVDWHGGNVLPYTQATANCRVVGAEIAHLVTSLENTLGAKQETFHCIGHSLGAQICGYAGARLRGLGRISGLDPAGPFFYRMPPAVRLDPSDAKFVDVIHSDASMPYLLFEGLGVNEMVGHLDFYPNNGNDQPGCQRHNFRKFVQKGGLVDDTGAIAAGALSCVSQLGSGLNSARRDRQLDAHARCRARESSRLGRIRRCGRSGWNCCAICAILRQTDLSAPSRAEVRKLRHKHLLEPLCAEKSCALRRSDTRGADTAIPGISTIPRSRERISRTPRSCRSRFAAVQPRVCGESTLPEWNVLEISGRTFDTSISRHFVLSFLNRGKALRHTLYCANNTHALASGEEIFLQETSSCPEF